MAQNLTVAEEYLSALELTPSPQIIGNPNLLYGKDGALEVYYAPFDHIATDAKLVIVGITPGLAQATNAFEAARGALRSGCSLREALRIAKLTGSFSGGVMRNNLVSMLDHIGVARLFGVQSTSALFRAESEFVHFTSALRYPVFVGGKNYNGSPDMLRTPLLQRIIETHLAEEAAVLPDAIWLPLGPKAEAAVLHLVTRGHLRRESVLAGLPHPSGANAERIAVFLGRKDPNHASRQTNATRLLQAKASLSKQICSLMEAN